MNVRARWETGTFWVQTVLSLVGCASGVMGYTTARRLADSTLEPKVFIAELSLSTSSLKVGLPVVRYSVQNRGFTEIRGVRTDAILTVFEDAALKTPDGEFLQFGGLEANLAPGDQAEQALLLEHPFGGVAPAPEFKGIVNGERFLRINIRLTGTGSGNFRLRLCESFLYNAETSHFERQADCDASTP